ncbi:trans-sulfuration enzyme family protein [Mobilicoccus pelagius]|uniref:homocysteine desulfhydrase n=1 Tax=Mobilicoccus pelagius NBRC 104925 TaxID=1089455 RepID=H5URA6_9MICO|nr:PLP-dependent transferase [Mobilicoccus pelagius]GAB48264.1 putative amino acid lyase [Mobilicoccus pelagius NBRC 104925]
MTTPDPLAPATHCVHAGRPHAPGEPVNPPVVLTSTFAHGGEHTYARESSPAFAPFEEAVGALEEGRALVLSSGMAAASAVLATVPAGGVVVAPRSAYMGVLGLLREASADGRIALREVDLTDVAAVEEALVGADLVWLESPGNPLMEVADLPRLLAAARAAGATSVVDNTFPTPILARPLTMGADVVLHSATKYLAGHSDVVLGILVTGDDERGRGLYDAFHHHRHLHGAVPGPMEVWLALRGLRTLALRVERASTTAAVLASRLGEHPAIERVRYPGSGAMLAVDVRGGAEFAERVCTATRLWVHSTSLGGVESQIERRRRYPSEPDIVPEGLLRLSVGIEDVEDLWRDLSAALDGVATA